MPNESQLLPNELYITIKNSIPIQDLRTHVHFYLSSPRIATLYNSEPDAEQFWELACWYSGIGRLPNDEEHASWQAIAIDTISRDGCCTHPHCGEALLQYNQQRMQETLEHVDPLDALQIEEDYDGAVPCPHPIFGHISFRLSTEVSQSITYPVDRDAYLRRDNASDASNTNARSYLSAHPLIARSFATSIPVYTIFLLGLPNQRGEDDKLRLQRPVTVFDVLRVLHRQLDIKLTLEYLKEFFSMHDDCLKNRGWRRETANKEFNKLRKIIALW
ncbi:hypothetical protein C8Q74DRAFT_1193743 [Fomes fomentarius]|nr:hypothetical protein C8Q74DRAFT_1193743 [Fomes fomentarius]